MVRTHLALLTTATICALLASPVMTAPAQAELRPNGIQCRDNIPRLQPLSLDTTFSDDGKVELEISEYAYATAGYLEDSGEAVLFGYSAPGQPGGNPINGEGIMQRLGADGSIGTITRFDAQVFGCSVPRNFLTARRLRNGDYAAAGYVQDSCGGIPLLFNVLRLRPDGIRLDEFDRVRFNNQLAYVQDLAEQPDGRIVASGFVSTSGFNADTYDFGVTRFNLDGSLDTTFGTDGTFEFDLAGDLDIATGVLIDDQGRILVGGYGTEDTTGRDILILRLTSAGAIDTSFGNNGLFRWDRSGFLDSAGAFALDGDRILVAGTSGVDADTREATILSVTLDGQLDTRFSDDGVLIVPLAAGIATFSDFTIGPSGRIYLTGSAEFGGTGLPFRDGVVTVLRRDGTPDSAFNGGEPVIFTFGDRPADLPTDIDLSSDGSQILITGYTEDVARDFLRFAAARFVGRQGGMFCDGLEDDGL